MQELQPETRRVTKVAHTGRKNSERYFLGAPWDKTYLTHQETVLALYVFHGTKLTHVAEKMNIGIRTVEFYAKGIRDKLGCKTTLEAIDLIGSTGFFKRFILLNNQIKVQE